MMASSGTSTAICSATGRARGLDHGARGGAGSGGPASGQGKGRRGAGGGRRVILPFGRYRGERLEDVPSGYLVWLLEEATLRSLALRAAIREELAERLEIEPRVVTVAMPARPPAELRPVLRDLARVGFRQLALDRHPDHGGTNQAMRNVLAAREWLAPLVSCRRWRPRAATSLLTAQSSRFARATSVPPSRGPGFNDGARPRPTSPAGGAARPGSGSALCVAASRGSSCSTPTRGT